MPAIAFFGDAEPKDTKELIKDFNATQTISPTGTVEGVFLMGDMTKDSGGMNYTIQALNGSALKNDPSYFVIGNHEYNSKSSTYPLVQGKLSSKYPLNYFNDDKSKNTYQINIDGINVFVLNIYYNNSEGRVSQAMFDWLDMNLMKVNGYKVVICHDPMYPKAKHVGNSLDIDKAMRDKLQAMFVKNHVNIFLGGHTHYAEVQIIGGIYHVCTGVIGPGTSQGEDPFATINYLYINDKGNLILMRKMDVNNSWSNPKIVTHTVGTGGTPTMTDLTLEQLKTYNGKNGAKAYVAVSGKIIDLTAMMASGEHNGHLAGQDLTEALKNKHGLDKIKSFPVVGNLITVEPTEKWGWKESGQVGVAGECVLNPTGVWTSKAACEAVHPPRVKWNGTACIPVGHLHEPDMFDTMEACLIAHPLPEPVGKTYEVLSMTGVKISMKDVLSGEVKNFEMIGMIGGTIRMKEVI